jgi:S-adenosylmethionine-diacylglycerol 3-amino-3-carboxypropyl transferase
MHATTTQLLKKAVHHNPAGTRRGASERAFTMWFSGFVYNQIWEDPWVDCEALQLDGNSRILTISSGGCNVLNYLLESPGKIVAIDLNTCHMSLTRLKLTAVEHMPGYEDFYNFFGRGNHSENLSNYTTYLRPYLDSTTLNFWEAHRFLGGKIGDKRIKYFARGFYDQSKLGLFLRFVHMICKLTDRDPNRIFEARTMADQERIFNEEFDPFFDSKFIRWLGKMPATVFSLGIPPSQYQIMEDEAGGNVIDSFRQRIRKLACGSPLDENYFAWQAFGRSYDNERRMAIPDYLREKNYPLLKQNVNRVETHIASLAEYLRTQPAGALNRFVLLDSQDWMPPEVIAELWSEIARVGEPGTRIIFRTAGEKSPIESSLPSALMDRFVNERDLARRLHEKDRSAIYGMFHVYSLKN